ncbi:unnamed protein product [Haemonchus placei]|uniref:Amidase domain-containing protein n=1 Tax=Haemonchus placei TaxID=6290 RepID=A0A158QNR8_HAEPC|nr:unnamed protein product [Haemonchus placei]
MTTYTVVSEYKERMGIASTLVFVISRIYFLMVLVIFRMVNHFKAKKIVPAPNDPLLMLSATEAVRKIRKREITSQQLIGAYTHRIEQVNELINAVVVKLFNEANQKAGEIDKSIADMDDQQLEELIRSKPLLGVPFTAKDALEVDGQVITCGIYAQKGIKRTSTAEVIKRMEAAGAILIAITNVPEACYWVETSNGIYGLTRNPYDTRRTVGGSSGGEGALISAAGSLIGIGSDIGGRIVPLDGHVPPVTGYPEEMLRVGPMCRYVEDLPILTEVKIRIFYMEGIQIPTLQSLSCEMRSTLLEAVKHFETKFNVEAIRLDLLFAQKAVEMLFASLEVEGEPKPSEYLLSLEGDKGKLNWKLEIPKYLVGKSVHTPGALLVAMIEDIDRTPETEKDEFRKLRSRLVRQVTETLGDNGILLFPSWPQTAPFHHQTVFTPFNCVYTGLFNVLALPVVQCPMGLDSSGLPLGVQVRRL